MNRLNIKRNIRIIKHTLSKTLNRKPKEQLVHDAYIRVRVRDIKRKGSNFEIEKCPQYLSAKMMVETPGISIKETPYYNFAVQLDHYLVLKDQEPEESCQAFFRLFNSIKKQGYQPDKYGYIEVLIGDNGEIKLYEGGHRLGILKAMGSDQIIKVKVKERSQGWLDFKKFIFETCQQKMTAYHPISHPDFANWNFLYGDDERFDTILKVIGNPKGKSVIDLGVQLGYFSFKLARLGAEVTGVDNQKRWVDACERLNSVYGTNVNFHHNDFVNVLCHYQNRKWDYGLFLNVFHWFAAQKEGDIDAVRRAMELLSIKIDNLFFSTGTLEESGMPSFPLAKVLKKNNIPEWICNVTKYKHYKYLLTDNKGRVLFSFTKR